MGNKENKFLKKKKYFLGFGILFLIVILGIVGSSSFSSVVLNSTSGNGFDSDNLTLSLSGNSTYNITDWRLNGTSLAVLNIPFDVNASAISRDYSTYGNNGTVTGATWISDGKIGGAYDFDGVDDYVGVGNDASLESNSLTVSSWVKMNVGADEYKTILGFGGHGVNRWLVQRAGDGSDALRVSWNSALLDGSTASALEDGNWHHVAFTRDDSNNNLTLYLDGQIEGSTTTPNDISFGSVAFDIEIGRRTDTINQYVNGLIDEVLVFNRSLSVEQINALYLDGVANKSMETLVSQETSVEDNYTVMVTSNDGSSDGTSVLSNALTIIETVPILQITDPTTTNYETVTGGENISFLFNFVNNSVNITSGVTVDNVTIGGEFATILGGGSELNTTNRTCSGAWGASCEDADPGLGDYSFDGCSAGSYYTASGFWVDEVTVNTTEAEIGETIQITCDFDTFNGYTWDDLAISYYNGDIWYQLWAGRNGDTSGTYTYSVDVVVNGSLGEQYARCSSGFYTNSPSGTCFTTTNSDNDDVNFTVVEASSPGAEYITDVGWQVNVTVPSGLSGYKDLFVNATYGGTTANDTESNSILYPDLNIEDPLTSAPKIVEDGSNISILFNILEEGANVTSGVTLDNVTIGGEFATILGSGGGDSEILYDTFSTITYWDNWVESGEGDWVIEAPVTDIVGEGSYVAHSDDCDTTCTLTSSSWDLSSYDDVSLDFAWGIHAFDAGVDYLNLEYYNGTGWTEVWTSGTGTAAGTQTINFTTYGLSSGSQIRFVTHSSHDAEEAEFDIVNITGVGRGEEFSYIANVGWQANVTVPLGLSGYQNLFVNATYGGAVHDDTETNAINYNSVASIPTNITCDGGNCTDIFYTNVGGGIITLNCSGSTDGDSDEITYMIYNDTTYLGNHTNGTTFDWNISSLGEETGIALNCKAGDLDGSGSYSDYFYSGSNLTLQIKPLNISLVDPSSDVDWVKDYFSSFTTEVCCQYGSNCGNVNVSLISDVQGGGMVGVNNSDFSQSEGTYTADATLVGWQYDDREGRSGGNTVIGSGYAKLTDSNLDIQEVYSSPEINYLNLSSFSELEISNTNLSFDLRGDVANEGGTTCASGTYGSCSLQTCYQRYFRIKFLNSAYGELGNTFYYFQSYYYISDPDTCGVTTDNWILVPNDDAWHSYDVQIGDILPSGVSLSDVNYVEFGGKIYAYDGSIYFTNVSHLGVGKGLMSTSVDSPFYTSSSNPQVVSLDSDECQDVTWNVNSTGKLESTHEIYSSAIFSDGSFESVETGIINVTIIDSYLSVNTVRIDPTNPLIENNLTGYCNGTDSVDDSNLTYYYQWYVDDVENISGQSSEYFSNVEFNVNNISSSLTSLDEDWILSCLASDEIYNSTWMNSSVANINSVKELQITDPTTSNYETVEDGSNISILFNLLEEGVNVTSGVTLNNITIGGEFVTFLPFESIPISRTCTDTWGASCEGEDPELGDYSFDGCAAGSYYGSGGFLVDEVTVNSTMVKIGEMVQITCDFDCNGGSTNRRAISYYNGEMWYQVDYVDDGSCTDGDYSVNVVLNGTTGDQYARCSIGYSLATPSPSGTCFDTTFSDNDDVNFTVVEVDYPAFFYVDDLGWQANFTVPSGLSSYQDLFVNVTYSEDVVEDTETDAIFYNDILINTVRIDPISPTYQNDLFGYCNGTDTTDASNLTYYYQWYVDDIENVFGQSSEYFSNLEFNVTNLSSSLTTSGESWILSCAASDGVHNSSWLNSSAVNISSIKELIIIDPTTTNYESVSDGDNISILFNLISDGINITSGVLLYDLAIGEEFISLYLINPTNRTCTDTWGASCEGEDPELGDYSFDGCAAGSYYGAGGFKVDEVTVNATSVEIGDIVQITCDFDTFDGQTYDDLAISYYNGDTWYQIWKDRTPDTSGYHIKSVDVVVNGSVGEQYARCSTGMYTYNPSGTCFTTTYSDNDDVNFTALGDLTEYGYITDVGWQVNVTVPSGLSGYQDLFLNATYDSVAVEDTEIDAIFYVAICNPLSGERFMVKNSTGDICFEVDALGNGVIYGGLTQSCGTAAPTGSFQIETDSGTTFWINETCDACVSGIANDSQSLSYSGTGEYYIQNVTGDVLMKAFSNGNLYFAGDVCYDKNSGSAKNL